MRLPATNLFLAKVRARAEAAREEIVVAASSVKSSSVRNEPIVVKWSSGEATKKHDVSSSKVTEMLTVSKSKAIAKAKCSNVEVTKKVVVSSKRAIGIRAVNRWKAIAEARCSSEEAIRNRVGNKFGATGMVSDNRSKATDARECSRRNRIVSHAGSRFKVIEVREAADCGKDFPNDEINGTTAKTDDLIAAMTGAMIGPIDLNAIETTIREPVGTAIRTERLRGQTEITNGRHITEIAAKIAVRIAVKSGLSGK